MAARSPRPKKVPASVPPAKGKPRLSGTVLSSLNVLVRLALVIYAVLIVYPIRYHHQSVGFDASGAVSLNLFHVDGLIWGRDVAFTYGPLSYLIVPIDVGSNLAQGILFQCAIWGAFALLLAWAAFVARVPLAALAGFAALLYPSIRLFDQFGYAGPDWFLALAMLLAMGCSLVARRWYFFYGAAVAAAALVALIKVSTGTLAMSAIFVFPVVLWLFDRKRAMVCGALAGVGAPLLFTAAYLLYFPSWNSLGRYVRSAMEISAGHSSALSQGGDMRDVFSAASFAVAYLAVAGVLLWQRQRSFALAIALLGPMFLEFKHAFIRYAGHIEIYFCFVPLMLALVVLFSDFSGARTWWLAAALALFACTWYARERQTYSIAYVRSHSAGLDRVQGIANLFHFAQLKADLKVLSDSQLAADRLPGALLARIGNRPVYFMPFESSYAAANAVNYRPPPLFHSGDAYTPYLDEWNAEFLADSARAPEFILLEWKTIDGRHPLLDTPAMSLALYRWYEFDSAYPDKVLLRRRARPRFTELRPIGSKTLGLGDALRYPATGHPIVAKVFLRMNPTGRLLDFFFRTEEMRITMSGELGRVLSARITPAVTGDGIAANFTPFDLDGVQALFSGDRVVQPLDALVISGVATASFEPAARAELYEIPEINLNVTGAAVPDLSALTSGGELESARIESLNGLGILGYGERETIALPDTLGYVTVTGWAADRSAAGPARAVYVELDGKLYPADTGDQRWDVVALMGKDYLNSGFNCTIPSWKLGRSDHVLALKIIGKDGKSYYDVSRKVRFRLVDTAP